MSSLEHNQDEGFSYTNPIIGGNIQIFTALGLSSFLCLTANKINTHKHAVLWL